MVVREGLVLEQEEGESGGCWRRASQAEGRVSTKALRQCVQEPQGGLSGGEEWGDIGPRK